MDKFTIITNLLVLYFLKSGGSVCGIGPWPRALTSCLKICVTFEVV
jgi:hypothetical protein